MDENDPNGGPNYLRAWREKAGLSQEELAEIAETTHQVIGYLERGRTQLSAKWLRRLAPILGTTPGHLLEHHPDEVFNEDRGLKGKVVKMFDYATPEQQRQIAEIVRTITHTGTDD